MRLHDSGSIRLAVSLDDDKGKKTRETKRGKLPVYISVRTSLFPIGDSRFFNRDRYTWNTSTVTEANEKRSAAVVSYMRSALSLSCCVKRSYKKLRGRMKLRTVAR